MHPNGNFQTIFIYISQAIITRLFEFTLEMQSLWQLIVHSSEKQIYIFLTSPSQQFIQQPQLLTQLVTQKVLRACNQPGEHRKQITGAMITNCLQFKLNNKRDDYALRG